MSENITVRGYVATELRNNTAKSGLAIASFRMCSTERRLDRESGTWMDGHTNWYTVSLFRQLATNAAVSIKKGDRVVVTGRLRVRPWINDEGKSGTSVEIDADTAGHDLMWGTANFRRTTADRSASDSPESAGGESNRPAVLEAPAGVDGETGEILDDSTDGAGGADVGGQDLDAAGDGKNMVLEDAGLQDDEEQAELAPAAAPF
jgi:single-strand DNA-binding protein